MSKKRHSPEQIISKLRDKEPWRYKRILSCYLMVMEAAMGVLLSNPPIIGGRQSGDVKPPAWKGKQSINEN